MNDNTAATVQVIAYPDGSWDEFAADGDNDFIAHHEVDETPESIGLRRISRWTPLDGQAGSEATFERES